LIASKRYLIHALHDAFNARLLITSNHMFLFAGFLRSRREKRKEKKAKKKKDGSDNTSSKEEKSDV
jgi:hypothetical protein